MSRITSRRLYLDYNLLLLSFFTFQFYFGDKSLRPAPRSWFIFISYKDGLIKGYWRPSLHSFVPGPLSGTSTVPFLSFSQEKYISLWQMIYFLITCQSRHRRELSPLPYRIILNRCRTTQPRSTSVQSAAATSPNKHRLHLKIIPPRADTAAFHFTRNSFIWYDTSHPSYTPLTRTSQKKWKRP